MTAGSRRRDFELAIEGFYKVQVTPSFNVQPDVQYIINPDGALQGEMRWWRRPRLKLELCTEM